MFFPNTSDPVDSEIVKDAVQCSDEPTCFMWSAVYHNISVLIKSFHMEIYRARGDWTHENNRPLLCEMEGGVVRIFEFDIMVRKGTPFF